MIEESLLRSLVWLDYRLAVLFLVILPLLLLIWATVSRSESIQRVLIIYWRVSSLLAITLYLMIGNLPIAFLSSFLARVLIPISLWFWVDLNEEIDDLRQSTLKLAFNAWRWAVTAYSVVVAIAFIPVLQCSFNQGLYATPFCQVWREAPLMYREALHAGYTLGFLGFWGIVGLVIYLLYLVYYALVRFGKNGRSAMEQ